MQTFYEILELSSNCSIEDIKNSYRQLCKIYHPDRNPDNSDKFIEIQKAYETLIDEDLRREYDLDLICSPNYKPQKVNIKNNIELTLDECYYGCLKKYRLFSGLYDVVVPQYSKPGDMFLLIGKGYPNGRYKTNLIIEIKVKNLLELNEEQLELVRRIKEIGER